MIGFEYHPDLLGPAVTSGVAAAALYGLLAVTLILVYRINRTIAFVQGGMATMGAFLYWWLATPSLSFETKGLPRGVALVLVLGAGAAGGALFGRTVSGRMANYPRVTVSTFGLGVALGTVGLVSTIWKGVQSEVVPPLVYGKVRISGYYVSYQQLVGLGLCVLVCAALAVVMTRTRTGIYVRAIADDPEAAEAVGIRVSSIGVGVWSAAGAIGALTGALLVPITTLQHNTIVSLLLRSLAAAVLGGFESFTFGISGALLLGLVESTVGAGVFGTVGTGVREMCVMAVLLVCILAVPCKWRAPSARETVRMGP